MREKICLVSPGHLSTNPRLMKEAKALTEAGYDVHVVHGSYITANIQIDRSMGENFVPCTAVRFGPARLDTLRYGASATRQKLARAAVGAGARFEFFERWANSQATPGLTRAACAVRADLYIAHYVAALPAAAKAASLHGAAYAFDAEDFHLGDLPDLPEHDLERHIIRAIEGRYLPGAAFVTAASPLIADAYADAYGITKPTVILNVFPRGNGPATPTSSGSAQPGPSLYWFSQTIGAGRGLETAVEAIALAQSRPHLHLRGTFATGYESTLRAHAARHGVADRLHVYQPVPPNDLEQEGGQFDLGYVGETGFSLNNKLALANKLFSYMTSGLAVIASNTPAHEAISGELGGALALFPIGDAAALACRLDALLLDPLGLARAREHAWRLGQERYCWDEESCLLINSLQRIFIAVEESE